MLLAFLKCESYNVVYFLCKGMESEPETIEPMASPPSFIRPVSNTMVPEGTPARLDAIFSGFPTPDITWVRNGIHTLTNSSDIKVSKFF